VKLNAEQIGAGHFAEGFAYYSEFLSAR